MKRINNIADRVLHTIRSDLAPPSQSGEEYNPDNPSHISIIGSPSSDNPYDTTVSNDIYTNVTTDPVSSNGELIHNSDIEDPLTNNLHPSFRLDGANTTTPIDNSDSESEINPTSSTELIDLL